MRLSLLLLILVYTAKAQCQSINKLRSVATRYHKQAAEAISRSDFSSATLLLEKAIHADTSFALAYQQLGDIHRKFNRFRDAESLYRKVLALSPSLTPLTLYGLAESLFFCGRYSDALIFFNKYKASRTLPTESIRKIEKYIGDCKFSIEALKNSKPVKFKNLGAPINSAFDEYLPSLNVDGSRLLFTRRDTQEDFYESKRLAGGAWSPPALINFGSFSQGNEGAAVISADGEWLYFSACDKRDGMGRCDIYVCFRTIDGWSSPKNLGSPINTGAWESQPSLSADGNTLYFVSNRPGGVGGYDIWISKKNSKNEWSVPVNAGPEINSVYDEHSPCIHADGKTLYFSSNGWPGFGKRDLFVTRKRDSVHWDPPQNLGYPINNSGEQSGLFVSADAHLAYFASQATDSIRKMDIYTFQLEKSLAPTPVAYLEGKVYDAITGKDLDAVINIKENNHSFFNYRSQVKGRYIAALPSSRRFQLIVGSQGYLYHEQQVTWKESDTLSKRRLDIKLYPLVKDAELILQNIFFETGSARLTETSSAALEALYIFLQQDDLNRFEISGHTDNTGSSILNNELSTERAKAVAFYLIGRGLDKNKIRYRGYGDSRPVQTNTTAEGRAANRRTSLVVL